MDKKAAEKGVSISNKETTNPINNIESIQITEDLTLILVPRIKLNFICGCICGFCDMMMQESFLKAFVVQGFRSSKGFYRTPLTISHEDVHTRYYSLPIRTDDMTVMADGFLFYRHPILMNREVGHKLRGCMLQMLPAFRFCSAIGSVYLVKYSLPPSEDPDKILTSVSSGEVPTLVIKGFPSHWFVDQPDSSQPSTQLLRMFFEKFGNVRDIHVEELVSVKYEDRSYLYKALQSLCGVSLQKHGSGEIVDYHFILNEEQGLCKKKKRALEYDILLPPSKSLNLDDVFKQLVNTEFDEEDVKTKVDDEDREQFKNEVDEEIKQVKTMVDENLKAFLSNLKTLF